jgi:hypothetical protein
LNSTTYHFHEIGYESRKFINKDHVQKWRLCHFEHEKYVNLGLLFGLKRSGGQVSITGAEQEWSFSQRSHVLIRDSPSWLQERVMGQFIHRNKGQLTRINLPWFIPESLGGLGLIECGKYKACTKDLILAKLVYDHPDLYPIRSLPVNSNWLTWKYAINRFGPNIPGMFMNDMVAGNSSSANHRIMSWNTLLGLACIEGLFRCTKEQLYKDSSDLNQERECMNILRKNSHSYKLALLGTKGQLKGRERFSPSNFPTKINANTEPFLVQGTDLLTAVENKEMKITCVELRNPGVTPTGYKTYDIERTISWETVLCNG